MMKKLKSKILIWQIAVIVILVVGVTGCATTKKNTKQTDEQAELASVSGADVANKSMTIVVKKGMTKEQALKSLQYYITDNFETLEVNDKSAGWIRTAWNITKFPVSTIRTRLELKEVLGDDNDNNIRFRFYLTSQRAWRSCGSNPECFGEWDRILKKYASLYSDMQNSVN